MRTNQLILLVVILSVVLARDAQAFYNPSQGRWLSRDPIEEQGGLNLYGFVDNGPVGKLDPCGPTENGKYGGLCSELPPQWRGECAKESKR